MNGFRSVKINGRWDLMLPEYRCFRFLAGDHEKERLASMALNLSPFDHVVDVGAEDGDLSCLISTFADQGQMTLVEPSRKAWPIIRATFEVNDRPPPNQSFTGFASDQTEYAEGYRHTGWPTWCTNSDEDLLLEDHAMSTMSNVPEFTYDVTIELDDLIDGPVQALNIDVEGCEMKVLQGAQLVLADSRPLVWISIHPQLLRHRWMSSPAEVVRHMEQLGYRAIHLGDDHESHWYFEPR